MTTPGESCKQIINKIIVNYTGDSYTSINKALTSTNPLILGKMSYYLQFLFSKYRNPQVGEKLFLDKKKIWSTIFRNLILE